MSGYARIGWGAFGLLVLLAGGLGAYFSTRPAGEGEPAPAGGKAFAFRVHALPQPIADLGFEDGEGRQAHAGGVSRQGAAAERLGHLVRAVP